MAVREGEPFSTWWRKPEGWRHVSPNAYLPERLAASGLGLATIGNSLIKIQPMVRCGGITIALLFLIPVTGWPSDRWGTWGSSEDVRHYYLDTSVHLLLLEKTCTLPGSSILWQVSKLEI